VSLDSAPSRSGSRFDAEEPFLSTLQDAIQAADGSGVAWVLMGGVGSALHGRPRWTHDIDLFVTPRGAGQLLSCLADAGFKTEETDPNWLFKGWKNGVLVDVIFRSSGSIYLDDEMVERALKQTIGDCTARVMAPEDLIVIKAVTADEHVPRHWHDCLDLLGRDNLDWDYLLRRARHHGVRRLLSLLLYAESNDIWVPPTRITELFDSVHPRSESQ
jgi:hypothetical protein